MSMILSFPVSLIRPTAEAMLGECLTQLRCLAARLSPMFVGQASFIFPEGGETAMVYCSWDGGERCLSVERDGERLLVETVDVPTCGEGRVERRQHENVESAVGQVMASLNVLLADRPSRRPEMRPVVTA